MHIRVLKYGKTTLHRSRSTSITANRHESCNRLAVSYALYLSVSIGVSNIDKYHYIRGFSTIHWPSNDDHDNAAATVQSTSSLHIPPHAAHKVCTAMDAVSLISQGDTLA